MVWHAKFILRRSIVRSRMMRFPALCPVPSVTEPELDPDFRARSQCYCSIELVLYFPMFLFLIHGSMTLCLTPG